MASRFFLWDHKFEIIFFLCIDRLFARKTNPNKGDGLMKRRGKSILAGGAAGAVNGLFGGGGGAVLVPLLSRWCGLEQKRAFATAVAVIFPLCLLSVVIYLFRGGLDIWIALPYVLGGTVGGWLGGKWFKGVRVKWLRRGFGALLIFSGARCFL